MYRLPPHDELLQPPNKSLYKTEVSFEGDELRGEIARLVSIVRGGSPPTGKEKFVPHNTFLPGGCGNTLAQLTLKSVP